MCNTRKTLLTNLKTAKADLLLKVLNSNKHSEECDYEPPESNPSAECPTCKSNDRAVTTASERVEQLEIQLEDHISNVCEADETASKYWCDGYKLCMGHKDYYKCAGKHKVVLCSGHTNINVEIKVMYKKKLLDEALKVFN